MPAEAQPIRAEQHYCSRLFFPVFLLVSVVQGEQVKSAVVRDAGSSNEWLQSSGVTRVDADLQVCKVFWFFMVGG